MKETVKMTSQEYELKRWKRNSELWAARRARWAAYKMGLSKPANVCPFTGNPIKPEAPMSEETRKEIADYYDRKTFNGD